jgi:hypothetical protein
MRERKSFAQNREVDRRRLQQRVRIARMQESKLPPLPGQQQPKREHRPRKDGEQNGSEYEYDDVDEEQQNGRQQRQDKGVQKVRDDPPEGHIGDVIGDTLAGQ